MAVRSFHYYFPLLICLLTSVGAGAEDSGSAMFKDLFQYELNNRAFALLSVTALAERMQGTEQENFWRAYADMEKYSQAKYEKIALKYEMEVSSSIVKLKVWTTNIAFYLFPETMMDVMSTATTKYVQKLEPLADLGKEEDRAFFNYVLAQEQTQALALQHAVNKNYDEAARSIESFLQQQK